MPKLNTTGWRSHPGAAHPASGQNDGPYNDIALGELAGLTQFAARLERLPPGSRSSHRHWHENEDELAYIIAGELVLIEDSESVLKAGDAVGWKAGAPVAHCLENRSGADAVLLIIGGSAERDVVHYPDHGLVMHRDGEAKRFEQG